MDSRSAAHVLSQIGALLEVKGGQKFKARAYAGAARALIALDTDDLGPLLRSGELAEVPGVGPATLSVVRELVETGESSYLDELREGIPEGLLELLRVPGLSAARVQLIHGALGVENLEDLERVAQNGQLASLPKFGKKTAEKVLRGIEILRRDAHLKRFPAAAVEAHLLLANIVKHPDITHADVAGAIRRHCEVVAGIEIVAECSADPAKVAASFARSPGVRESKTREDPGSVHVRFVDGTHLDMHCVGKGDYPVALWRATGSADHVEELTVLAQKKGFEIMGNSLIGKGAKRVDLADEESLFTALDLQPIPPEMREGMGEIEAAARRELPNLVTFDDIRGVLHCHSDYSDGAATIEAMAVAAKERGWDYIGISDHSESAFYAGGLKRDRLPPAAGGDRRAECADGWLSDPQGNRGRHPGRWASRLRRGDPRQLRLRGRVDPFAIQYGWRRDDEARAGGDGRSAPHDTGASNGQIASHPRTLPDQHRGGIEKAVQVGVAVELNADPHRLDLDWRYCRQAKELGVTIEIGPDAHSTAGLDNVHFGIGMARKAWLEAGEILNARSADEVLSFARKRRTT